MKATIRVLAMKEALKARVLLSVLQDELKVLDSALSATYLRLKDETPFGDIGTRTFDMTTAERLTRDVARLEAMINLGYELTEEP